MQPRTSRKLLFNSAPTVPPRTRRSGSRWFAGIAGILVAVSGAHSQNATAKEATLRPSYYACVKTSSGVTLALNDCIGTEHAFQDKRLNAAYQQLRKSLPRAERVGLRDEERAWIIHRDKACEPEPNEGTASLLDANQCQLDETAARAAALEARLGR